MSDDEKLIAGFFAILGAVIVGIIIFCMIPVEEKVRVEEVSWHWTVGVMEYQKCSEKAGLNLQ